MVLPTMLAGTNLTIITDEINGTEYITVESFSSETTIVTPAAFACNVSLFKHCVLFCCCLYVSRKVVRHDCSWS